MATQTPLQIFKPGNHTAMSGAVLAFSESDLVACAKAYDPAKHEAPLVVGHPQHNAPAYGWVKSLSVSVSDGLQAVPDQVDPAFAELVSTGRFKKISASFYSPNSPQNPVPGVYYLRHVGFLGAQPPAVKGLRSPEFAEGEEGVVQFGDMELDDQVNAGLWRKMREWLIGRFGQADADQVVSNDAISTLEQAARDEAAEAQAESQDTGATPGFIEPTHEGDAMSAEDKARLDALEAENKRLKAEAEARDRAARHASHASFVEGLVREGKLLPGHQDRIVSFMDYIAGADAADVVEFAEAGGTKKCAPLEAFKDYLVAQPKLIDFAERAGSSSSGAAELTDPKAIVSAANKYAAEQEAAGNSIQFAEAVAHVVAQSKQ